MYPVIDIHNVSVFYREQAALLNIFLKVYQGDFLAIAGPNGSGKTTLLRVINGLAGIEKGFVNILGVRMQSLSANRVRREIGYVPQRCDINPKMPIRVKEVIMMGRYGKIGFFKNQTQEDKIVFESIVELMKIKSILDKPIGHLSGGEKQKVAIARALTQEPKILLLDEPISSLDIDAQANILELIERVHKEKLVTTVLVMHNLEFLPEGCNRMLLIKDANIIFDGAISEALNEDILSKVYSSKIRVIHSEYGLTIRVEKGNK